MRIVMFAVLAVGALAVTGCEDKKPDPAKSAPAATAAATATATAAAKPAAPGGW